MLTQEELKRQLNYNEETGIFTNRITRSIRSQIGKIPGTESKQQGYVRIRINGKFYLAHRLAWLYVYGAFPEMQIDHINGIRNDNRIINLRNATHSQNNLNCTIRSDNSSGFKGVYWCKSHEKWQARAMINRKNIHIGYYTNREEAGVAYQSFAQINHGSFFRAQ